MTDLIRMVCRFRSPWKTRKLEEAVGLATRAFRLPYTTWIKRIDETEVRRGGLVNPDSATEKPKKGKVLALGQGTVTEDGKKIPLDVKAGDRVLFGKYSGSEVTLDGKDT
jgi:chaperonin GroES